MDLDAGRIVPRPWQPLLRTLIGRLVLHALNDDGAPDGTSILRVQDLCMASSWWRSGQPSKRLQKSNFRCATQGLATKRIGSKCREFGH